MVNDNGNQKRYNRVIYLKIFQYRFERQNLIPFKQIARKGKINKDKAMC